MDDHDRDEEHAIFDIICTGRRDEDDGSQYLNESGEGIELQTRNDGTENVGHFTESGEVY